MLYSVSQHVYTLCLVWINPMWFRIKGYEKDIGRDITFWLWGDDEKHIRSILSQKHNITDVQYIEQDTPSFID